MTQFKLLTSVCMAALLMAGGLYAQDKSLTMGSATGANVTLEVTLASDAAVQGFVLAVSYDPALTATDVRAAGATIANNAELVVPELLTGGFTLGVVMDFDPPYDGQVIPDGTSVVAEVDFTADVAGLALEPGEEADLPVVFAVAGLNSPLLYNTIVVGGMSYTAAEGVVLNDGNVKVVGKGDDLKIVSTLGADNVGTVTVPVVVDNNKPVEGYVLSVGHPTDITLDSIAIRAGSAAEAAEFFVAKIYANGGTFGVVMDFDAPYLGQVVDIGVGNELAAFTYSRPVDSPLPATRTVYPFDLTFVDGVFGSPLLYNTLVEGGMSVPPNPINGTVTFACVAPIEPETPAGFQFYVGGDLPPDSAPADLGCAVGSAGAEVKMVFYYTSVSDDPLIPSRPIQGISMAVTFPPILQVADLDPTGQGIVDATHLDGTVTKGINAEFVSFNANNTTGELVIGILVDSTPPVPINHMYPPRDTLGKVLNVYFTIPEGIACDTQFDINFQNPVFGAGTVPISNRVAVFNYSYPATFDNDGVGGCITVGGVAAFIRGDCNTDQWVDIADPAATMSYLFLGVFAPQCLDACDSNDDGVVDLADTVSTLRFLFKLGPILPAPGPYPPGGYDPTPDIYDLDLGCVAGDPCN